MAQYKIVEVKKSYGIYYEVYKKEVFFWVQCFADRTFTSQDRAEDHLREYLEEETRTVVKILEVQ